MIPPLSALQAFEAIARRRSFALAAQELRQASAAIERLAVKVERDPAALVAGSGTKRTVEWRE